MNVPGDLRALEMPDRSYIDLHLFVHFQDEIARVFHPPFDVRDDELARGGNVNLRYLDLHWDGDVVRLSMDPK